MRDFITGRGVTRCVAVLAAASAIAGCASANKTQTTASGAGSSKTTASSSGMSGMSGMSSMGSDSVPEVNGIKPIPSQLLATAEWQGMKIEARTMTAAPFMIYNGTGWSEVKATPKTSFHLMVMLNDAHTGVAIPYSTVWATFTKAGKVDYDERMWPMISAFMGPHYGNNVSLDGAGHYQLTLLISPPIAARHLEYKDVWLKPHRVTVSFNWKPTP
jgi:hypothetical protein